MKKISVAILFILFSFFENASAQGIKGYIRNSENEPLAYATIFIQQTGTGTVTNDDGYYEINLTPGDYSIVYQFLGHNTLVKKISIGADFKSEDVILETQTLSLGTVEIYEGRENPAYTIIRKAIAKADYHRQQVQRYTAQVYVKGSGRIKKIPWLARRQLKKEGIDTSSAFLVESVNEIEFERPDKLKEKVVSIRKQGNDGGVNAAPYINGSFYRPEVADAVSPLSPRAFAYYRFELEGSYIERGYEVNKIKVVPRNRGEGVFEGTIYILDDLWSIHSVDLASYKLGFKVNVNQIYAPITPNRSSSGVENGSMENESSDLRSSVLGSARTTTVWMPVTHRINLGGKALGFDLEYKYLATTSNYNIEINPDLQTDFTVIDETIEKELAAALAEKKAEKPKKQASDLEKKLQSGEKLTRKDLRKMMKNYEKEDRKKRREEESEPIVDSNRTFETDSVAETRDSAFWAAVRPIPLTKYEIKGYQKVDSLAVVDLAKQEKNEKRDSARSGGNPFSTFFGTLFFGNSFKLSKKTRLVFQPTLLRTNYNLVEGWNTSIPFSLRFKTGKTSQFRISPTYNIAFSPFVQDGNLELSYRFGKAFRRGKICVDGGEAIFQFNPNNPIDLLSEETYFILFEEKNFAKFYQKRYFKTFFEKQVSDYFSLRVEGERADRNALFNRENPKSWIKYSNRSFTPNNPENVEIEPNLMPDNRLTVASLGFTWFPYQKYRKYNNVRMLGRNAGPVFHAAYRKAFNDDIDQSADFDFLKIGVDWDHELPAGTMLRFRTKAGKFLNKKSFFFPDFHHFRGNRTRVVFEEPVGNFRLAPYYKFSTGDQFVEAHFHSQLRQFALTQIPELWMLGLKENLFASYLTTPTAGHYFEVGYGLDNLYKFFRLEFVASFLNGKYDDFNVRIGVASGFNFGAQRDEDGEGVTVKL